MISEMFPKDQVFPDNIIMLYGELEKLLRIVNTSVADSHLASAEKMLFNLQKKWGLSDDKHTNLICQAIYAKICEKKENFHNVNGTETIA
jgi:hypothetical protein